MTSPTYQLIARLRRAARPRDASDGVALSRYAQHHDSEAFTLLVQRFGPMVRGVCRRVLGDTPDADDAFQATFLVLMRKARTVHPPEAVGSWLFAVAHRTAVYARTVMTRRSAKYRPLDQEPASEPPHTPEVLAALDTELAALPDKFRDAVVLCELHGKSLKETADALGVPVGTLASRLARGRQMLADRLKGKGYAVSAATVSGMLASGGVATACGEFDPLAVGVSTTKLADGVMKMSLLSKLKLITAATFAALTVGLFGFGLVPGSSSVARAAPVPKADEKLSQAKVKEFDELWQGLLHWDAESSRAALGFVKQPAPAVTYLKQKVKPLKMDEAEAKKLIARLGNDKEEVWKEAENDLMHRPPILAMKLPDIWAEVKETEHKNRLAVVLIGGYTHEHGKVDWELAEQPGNTVNPFVMLATPKPGQVLNGAPPGRVIRQSSTGIADVVTKLNDRGYWERADRAVLVLEHIGTPEAVKLIEQMAEGHPDAQPTQTAKEALARLKKQTK